MTPPTEPKRGSKRGQSPFRNEKGSDPFSGGPGPFSGRVLIVGGGLAGSLLAILLARHGLAPCVVERSSEEESRTPSGGRSINLALAARGITALERADLRRDVEPLLIPMRGRSVHEPGEGQRFLPYGQRSGEEIYSVPRATLNGLLQRLARERFGVEYRYRHKCVGVDGDDVVVESPDGRQVLSADAIFAADGAGSVVRRSLAEAGRVDAREELLDHGYVELTIPPAPGGDFALRPDALHIWPRGGFMLIALPNPDRSFTATLFLPLTGNPSFEALHESGMRDFFAAEFADVLPLIPELDDDARQRERRIGTLGTVYCSPWSYRERILLIGDAAHAIVPFHGQGMNAAFEDCTVLDALVAETGPDWPQVFRSFERRRADDAAAIAVMAIENYREMRDSVRAPDFELRRQVAFELERRHPGRFVPRYSMVMFHPEIPYADALRRGALQEAILTQVTAGAVTVEEVDFDLAARLVEQRL